jgi:diamine N-acetyltransferase
VSIGVRLEQIGPENVDDACGLEVLPGQEKYVASVARSLADAYVHPETAWPRVVMDGSVLVGFLMGAFPGPTQADPRTCGIWRLAIGAGYQGRGYGSAAVGAFCAEARARGMRRVLVQWTPGGSGPEGFYLRLGFRPISSGPGRETTGEVLLS